MFGKNKTLKFPASFKTRGIWKINELKIEKRSWRNKEQTVNGSKSLREYYNWLKKSRNKIIAVRT